MAESGRLKMALERFIEQTLPDIDYDAQYPGTIVSQSGQTFDFQPDSPKVPGIQGLSFFSGTPGVTITVDTSKSPRAVLFFQNGRPDGAALAFFANPGLSTYELTAETSIQLATPLVKLGGAPTDFLVLGTTYRAAQFIFDTAFNAFLTGLTTFITALSTATTFLQVNTAATAFLSVIATFVAALATFDSVGPTQYVSTVSETQ